ncbi:MAG: DUF3107 family protein [Acidimicrobiia bacterium]|nr:DUF3107 family protein [Acidimicrobiia bacterium]
MDLRIGIAQTSQIIELELDVETDRAALRKQIDETLSEDDGVLWIVDRKGKETAVPSSRISFVELSSVDPDRRIGFGA